MSEHSEGTREAQYLNESVRKQRIEDSKYNVQWIVDALNANDPAWRKASKGHTVTRVTAADISLGKGVVSKISKVTIIFENGSEYAVALKVPTVERLDVLINWESTTGSGLQQTLEEAKWGRTVRRMHERECDFYAMHTERVGIPLPGIYALEYVGQNDREGAILMEYLGYSVCCVPFVESFTLQQLRNVACCLARLHAFSLDIEEDRLASLRAPKEFETLFVETTDLTALRTLEADPSSREPYDRVKHLFKPANYMDYFFYGIHKELGIRPVLCHGDLWNNNILMKKHADGVISTHIQAIIDWQTMHAGNPGADFAMILGTADAEIRREAEVVIFDVYYETLESETARKGKPTPFTREQFEKAYRRSFVGLAVLWFVSTMMMEEVLRPKVDSRISEACTQKVLLRVRLALLDAIEIVDREIPEWLNPEYRYVE